MCRFRLKHPTDCKRNSLKLFTTLAFTRMLDAMALAVLECRLLCIFLMSALFSLMSLGRRMHSIVAM